MSRFFIEPYDLLFFKDGRELQAGTEYTAEGVFPPMPSTVYGALRSKTVTEAGGTFDLENFGLEDTSEGKQVGTLTSTGTLRIEDFIVAFKHEKEVIKLFPVPQNLLFPEDQLNNSDSSSETLHPCQSCPLDKPDPTPYFKTNLPDWFNLSTPFKPEGTVLTPASGYLGEKSFESYLKGELTNVHNNSYDLSSSEMSRSLVAAENLYRPEPRMHTALSNQTKSVQESKLFTIDYIRPQEGTGIIVDTNLDSSPFNTPYLRLGGESRPVNIKQIETNDFDKSAIISKIRKDPKQRFKLVLTTPAVFESGWIPDGIDPDTGKGVLPGTQLHIQLLGATLPRYTNISGWDLSKNRPKPAQRGVQAGSVYFFQLLEGQVEELVDVAFGKSIISDNEFNKQGFGITYTGAI